MENIDYDRLKWTIAAGIFFGWICTTVTSALGIALFGVAGMGLLR